MRGSHEKFSPPEFDEWRALECDDWKPNYDLLPGGVKQSICEALYNAQRSLCVYCGRKLKPDEYEQTHIEHFRPRSTYPDCDTDLGNLFLSCGPKDEKNRISETCGKAKDNWFDENNAVEPDYPLCTRRFRFLLSGKVVPASENDDAARTMIQKLNLNHSEYKKDREDILYTVHSENLGLADFLDSQNGRAESYAHVVGEHLCEVIP